MQVLGTQGSQKNFMGLYFLLGEGLRYKFSEIGPINELDDSDFGNLSLQSKLN